MPDLSKVTAILPDVADYIVYAAIVMVTLIGFFKCLFPLWGTTRVLRRAIRKLQDDAGNTGKPIWQENSFMGKRLRGIWLRFLQNAEQLDRRGLPTNVEDYINDDTVTHGPGNATLAELIPNLLTSLGILGTFIGLSTGLSSLNLSDANALIEGIPDLLSGMKFAFGTSVAGITCSLVFNMLNRISQGSSYRAIDDFVTSFTQLAMSRPLDNDVQLICQNQDRNRMLSEVTDTLGDRVAEDIAVAISTALKPVSESMDRFLVGTTRNQIEGVTHIVNQFVDRMNASLNGQFLELGRTMAMLNQNQALSAERADASLRSVSGIVDNAEKLQGLTENIMAHFNAYVAEMNASRNRDDRFEESSFALLNRMQQSSQDQANMIALIRQYQDELSRNLVQFREHSEDNMLSMRKNSENSSADINKAGKSLENAEKALAKSCENFAAKVSESMTSSMASFGKQMAELTAGLNARVDAMKNENVTVSAGEIQRTVAEIQKDIGCISETLVALKQEA